MRLTLTEIQGLSDRVMNELTGEMRSMLLAALTELAERKAQDQRMVDQMPRNTRWRGGRR